MLTSLGTTKPTYYVPESMWQGVTAYEQKSPCLLVGFRGMKEFSARSRKERLQRYRRFVYEAAALKRSRGKSCTMIDKKIIAKENKTDYKNTRAFKFRYRTRYFSDAGIIGSKAFVSKKYNPFKDIFQSIHEKKPKPIKGLAGIYSLKRLSES